MEEAFTGLKVSSPGWDNISSKVVKHVADSISHLFLHVCNLSFSIGTVPTELKLTRVTPIFKSSDPTSFPNYRLISVLPVFSKVIEKLYARLLKYLNKFDTLSNYQFDFRKHNSTSLAITYLVN